MKKHNREKTAEKRRGEQRREKRGGGVEEIRAEQNKLSLTFSTLIRFDSFQWLVGFP